MLSMSQTFSNFTLKCIDVLKLRINYKLLPIDIEIEITRVRQRFNSGTGLELRRARDALCWRQRFSESWEHLG